MSSDPRHTDWRFHLSIEEWNQIEGKPFFVIVVIGGGLEERHAGHKRHTKASREPGGDVIC